VTPELTLAQLALYEIDALESEHDKIASAFLDAARDAAIFEIAKLEDQAAEVRIRHAAGKLDDNAATRALWLLDEERRELCDELGNVEQLRYLWSWRKTWRAWPEMDAAISEEQSEVDESREAWRADHPAAKAPTWAPVTDDEISDWREWCAWKRKRAA
jgi:hypothetical protein